MRVSEMKDPVIMWDASKGLYWRDNACGYTGAAEVAGVYERAEAQKYCNGERRIELLKVPEDHVQFLRDALDTARAKAEELRKDAERYRWRPISEAHEDHGECVYLNINDPGDICLAHVCDLNYEEKVKRMTHFALLPKFGQEEYEELIAAQRQKEKV